MNAQVCKFWSAPRWTLENHIENNHLDLHLHQTTRGSTLQVLIGSRWTFGGKKRKAKEELSLGANSDWTLMNAIGRSCTVCHSDFPTKGTKGWKLVQIHPKNLFKMRSSGLKLQLRSGGAGFWFMVVQTWCPYIFHPSLSFPPFLGWCCKTFFPPNRNKILAKGEKFYYLRNAVDISKGQKFFQVQI